MFLNHVGREAATIRGLDLRAGAATPHLLDQKIGGRQALLAAAVLRHALREADRLIRAGREQIGHVPRPVRLFAAGQRGSIDTRQGDVLGLGVRGGRLGPSFTGRATGGQLRIEQGKTKGLPQPSAG